jgi:hypothetical protein
MGANSLPAGVVITLARPATFFNLEKAINYVNAHQGELPLWRMPSYRGDTSETASLVGGPDYVNAYEFTSCQKAASLEIVPATGRDFRGEAPFNQVVIRPLRSGSRNNGYGCCCHRDRGVTLEAATEHLATALNEALVATA